MATTRRGKWGKRTLLVAVLGVIAIQYARVVIDYFRALDGKEPVFCSHSHTTHGGPIEYSNFGYSIVQWSGQNGKRGASVIFILPPFYLQHIETDPGFRPIKI